MKGLNKFSIFIIVLAVITLVFVGIALFGQMLAPKLLQFSNEYPILLIVISNIFVLISLVLCYRQRKASKRQSIF